MNNIVKQLSFLYEQELYSDMVKLAELSMSFYDQKSDSALQPVKFQLHVYHGEALYHLGQFQPAERAYTIALQIKKALSKSSKGGGTSNAAEWSSSSSSSSSSIDNAPDRQAIFNDLNIRFRIYLCHMRLKQSQKAIEILQGIPAKARTPKVNAALGNLYRDSGMERSAVACYKEVLREVPSAVDAAENLLRLGIKGTDVNSMTLGATSECAWVDAWLRGLAEMCSRDHTGALATFRSLDAPGCLKNNVSLLVELARCHNLTGNDKKALAALLRARHVDPHFITGRDLFAGLLAASSDKEHLDELDRLVPDCDTSLWSSEHWVVLGYQSFAVAKYDRALFFGQQALLLNRRNVEALLLKGSTFMQIGKYAEASAHFREAVQYCPHRFEPNRGLVQSYIAMNRLREATAVANIACKQMNHSSAAMTLYASVLLKDPMNNSRARSLLEKAIKADPTYMLPVRLLAEHFISEHSYDSAVSILQRHLEVSPSSRVHQMLGDCFVRLQKDDDAFEHFNAALRMDPQNQRALEGLNNIGRPAASQKIDANYYISPVDENSTTYSTPAPAGSDQEGEPDSDTDDQSWLNSSRDVMSFD